MQAPLGQVRDKVKGGGVRTVFVLIGGALKLRVQTEEKALTRGGGDIKGGYGIFLNMLGRKMGPLPN